MGLGSFSLFENRYISWKTLHYLEDKGCFHARGKEDRETAQLIKLCDVLLCIFSKVDSVLVLGTSAVKRG